MKIRQALKFYNRTKHYEKIKSLHDYGFSIGSGDRAFEYIYKGTNPKAEKGSANG